MKRWFLPYFVLLGVASAESQGPPWVHEVAVDPAKESADAILAKAASVVASPRQLDYHRLEFTCFVHFGPNTFTGVEWGSGKEDPTIFRPGEAMDTDQWCRVAKAAGMKLMLITVKHHDGFCTWQTRYNDSFSVRATPWKDGKGDVLRSLSDSCKKHGLKLGVYLSPADLYQIENAKGLYGNGSVPRATTIPTDAASFLTDPTKERTDRPEGSPVFKVEADDYNRYFLNQLYELLTEYGPIHEVWFDGAHPKRKGGQTYMKEKWFEVIRTLAPEAVIFGGPDVRWCGNEGGGTRGAEWNILPVESLALSGEDRPDADIGSNKMVVRDGYQVYGEKRRSNALYYLIPEVNTSIRAGWFWRNEHEQSVRSADDVFDIYERGAGGNGVFLLNVPPSKDGLFGERDVACLQEVGRRIQATYGDAPLMKGASSDAAQLLDHDDQTGWQAPAPQAEFTVRLPKLQTVNRVVLQEGMATVGQRVIRHALDARIDGKWQEVAHAETIGYKKILRFPVVITDEFRVRILDSRLAPSITEFSAHYYDAPLPVPTVHRNNAGQVVIEAAAAARFTGNTHKQGDSSQRLLFRYTTDGTSPSVASAEYKGPLDSPHGGHFKAAAFSGEKAGPVADVWVGMQSKDWRIAEVSSEESATYGGAKAIDGDPATFWHTAWSRQEPHPHTLLIDLGQAREITGFTYLPRQDKAVPDGMVESGEVSVSSDGKQWSTPQPFHFGNLVNDPSLRMQMLSAPASGVRYFKFVSKQGAAGKPYAGAAEIGLLGQ